MGKGNKQTTNTSSTSTTSTQLPGWVQQQAQNNLWQGNYAAQNFSPAMQQTPAGMTQDQYGADYLANNGLSTGTGAVQSGVNAATGVAGYTPQTVNPASYSSQGYTASTVPTNQGYTAQGYNPAMLGQASTYNATTGNASQINPNAVQQVSSTASPEALQGYLQALSPVYQQQMQAALAPLQQAYQQSINQNGAQAAQAGAFGDSRQGVMDAQSSGLYQQNVAGLTANLEGQMLNQGTNLYQQQQNNALNAQEANQGTALSAGTTNANLGQGMTLANLGYQNTAGQFNANANNNFSLANQAAANQASQFGAGAANTAAQSGMQAQLEAELANQNSTNAANQFGASAANQAGQYNASNQQQASLANQQAGLAGAGLNLSAAGTLGGLGQAQQGMNLNNISALNGLGTQQQNYNQSVLNTNYANAQAQALTPIQQAELQQQFLQNTPYGTTTTSNSTGNGTTVQSPTLTSQIMQGIGAGLQIPAIFASDERLKDNIEPMNSAMDAVRKIKPAAYTWKGDPTKRKNIGLIAQNVEAAAPAAVSTMPNGVKAVHVPAMLGLLAGAVQHLDKKVSKRK